MAFDIGEALEKAGVDDILLGNKQARGEKAKLEASSDNPYFTDSEGNLCRLKTDKSGQQHPVRLANFTAMIAEENIVDDGRDVTQHYTITGRRNVTGLATLTIPSSQFLAMNWIHHWGTDAIISPGQMNKEYVRYAIQLGSDGKVKRSRYFAHTGWRIINGNSVYLTNGGAIGGKGVSVQLTQDLVRYQIPLEPENEAEAIRTSLSFLDLGKRAITLPLLLVTYLSPLTTLLSPMPNFSSYVYGHTGTFKSSLSILQLAHFGQFTGIDNLSNFDDSANSIEKRGFVLKDALLVLDDYHPSYRRMDAQAKESIAQRLIRSFSNRTARGRLNADTSDKGRYAPRGMLQITGEEIVTLQSTLARIMVIEITEGDIDSAKLSQLQSRASLLPHAMSSYLLWIREHIDEISVVFPKRFLELREKAILENEHRKLPEQVAFLFFTLELVTNWLTEKGALSHTEAEELASSGWTILNEVTARQAQRIHEDDPVKRFADIIAAMIHQDAVCLEAFNPNQGEPIGAGDKIGYHDELYLYLLPTPVWHSVKQYCIREGDHFPFSPQSFYGLLRAKHLLVAGTDGKATIVIKRKGRPERVLKIVKGGRFNLV